MKIRELKQRRAALIDQQRDIANKAEKEGRDMTPEEESKFEDLHEDIRDLEAQYKRAEAMEEFRRNAAALDDPIEQGYQSALDEEDAAKKKRKVHAKAFESYARHGKRNMENGDGNVYLNALQEGTDSEGGYLVPEEWANEIVMALNELVVIRRYAGSIQTMSDRNIPVETTRGNFAWIAEEGSYTESDPAFGNEVLGAHKAGGIIKVSEELLQDNAFNLRGYLTSRGADKFRDLEEDAFINGDGTNKPTGLQQITTVAGVTVTGATAAASTTTVTADEMIETYYSLPKKYRSRAIWITSDIISKIVRKLKDSQGQYLWQPALTDGEPDSFLGRPFETSDSMAVPASDVRSVLFTDLSYYVIGDRLGIGVQRLDELYAATGQVGFRFTRRLDGKPTLAEAITFLKQAT